MSNKPIAWGIIGAGVIAEKMADALSRNADSRLAAVASKSPERAEGFAARNSVPRACSYEEIVADPEIDVIYVATTHNYHFSSAKLVLEAGKPLVMEKPFTVNAGEAETLVALAEEKNLFLMEAIWVRFLPTLKLLRARIAEGAVGDIKQVSIAFGNFIPPQYEARVKNPSLAGGVTLDMGIYPISVICYLLGEIPSQIASMCRFSDQGIDEIADYLFRFPSGCLGQICTSFNLKMLNACRLYGTTGIIEFPAFPGGNSFTLHRHEGSNQLISAEQFSETHEENGFVYQVEEAVRCLRTGETWSPIIPPAETVSLMRVMDTMREQWGFKYAFE